MKVFEVELKSPSFSLTCAHADTKSEHSMYMYTLNYITCCIFFSSTLDIISNREYNGNDAASIEVVDVDDSDTDGADDIFEKVWDSDMICRVKIDDKPKWKCLHCSGFFFWSKTLLFFPGTNT